MQIFLRSFLIALLFVSCACQKDPAVPAPVEANRPVATSKTASSVPASSLPVDPNAPPPMIAKEKLEAQIPSAVGDWKRIQLRCAVQPISEGDVQQADGVYQVGDQLPMIYISLLDSRGFRSTHGLFHEMHDHPTAGITPFEHAGQPALEQFLAKPLNTVLMTLVDDRYLIIVNGEGSDQATVRKFLDAIDIKAIAALK